MNLKLLDRCKIGNLELKNRMALSPITTGFGAENGCFGDEEINFVVERAKGGVSMVFTDAVSIDRHHQIMVASPLPYLDNDEQITRYSRYVDLVHHHGAKTCIQLYHAGRQTTISKRGGKSPVGPSAVSSMMVGKVPYPDAVEMTTLDIDRSINDFALAASRAKNAGFDAIDIDGGAGYLIQQFMSPLTNKRRDGWGGSLEKRMRYPLEIINRCRHLLGSDYPLVFDLCLDEMADGGITPEEGLDMAEMLEAAGIDAFRIHNVNIETYHHMFPPTGSPIGTNVDQGALLKKRLKKAKVMLGKRINDPELAERVLQEEAADFILLARPLIADPYFANKVKKGQSNTIRKCIGCNSCADSLGYARPIHCVLNPVVGFEKEYSRLTTTNDAKKILVIGGGIAGLEASKVATERGHSVILAEKSSSLGGQIKYAAATPFKEEMSSIITYYEAQMDRLGVDVRLNMEINSESIAQIKPDVAILATGANPVKPRIPGVDETYVYFAEEILQNRNVLKSGPVVVIGGGCLGAEIAELCALEGREVNLLEASKFIAKDMGPLLALSYHDRQSDYDINILTEVMVTKIEDNKVFYSHDINEEEFIIAETVILATGYRSDRNLEQTLNNLVDEVVLVGDCNEPRKIINAVHEGFHAARMIE